LSKAELRAGAFTAWSLKAAY